MTTISHTNHTASPGDMTLTPAVLEHVLFEMKRLIVGQDHLLERRLVALLAMAGGLLSLRWFQQFP